MTLRIIFSLLLATLFITSEAKVALPALISDGMVVRAGNEANMWGKSTPGQTVTVIPSWSNRKYSTVADADGRWSVKINPGKASREIRHIDFIDGDTVRVNDVLVGEVWLCTGQSNMVFPVGDHTDTLVWQTGMIDAEEQLADATYPDLRLFTVDYAISADSKLEEFSGRWVKADPETVYDFSAVGFVFGRRLLKELHRPIGLIQSAVGATSIESWINIELQNDPMYNYMKKRYAADVVTPKTAHRIPGGLWNGMIYPINPYSVTGTIWYQGEGNSVNASTYRAMMKTLIESWRADRKQPDMPFYYVQIAPFHNRSPYIREAQLEILDSGLGNVGMAVITDAGDSLDIHPRNKVIPGERLALIALDKTYHKNVVSSGPIMKHVKFENGKAVVTFSHADGLKSGDGTPLKGFTLAGDDRKFHPAKAEIRNGKIIVESAEVANPVALRFGFENFPRLNLFNSVGLPASPFRTDKWDNGKK